MNVTPELKSKPKYVVVEEYEKEDFLKLVAMRLETGWELQGGVCVVMVPGVVGSVLNYYQAMVKHE